jgi:hypothetical protein
MTKYYFGLSYIDTTPPPLEGKTPEDQPEDPLDQHKIVVNYSKFYSVAP